MLNKYPGNIIFAHHNIYNNPNTPSDSILVQTFYEKKFLKEGKSIKYIQFQV